MVGYTRIFVCSRLYAYICLWWVIHVYLSVVGYAPISVCSRLYRISVCGRLYAYTVKVFEFRDINIHVFAFTQLIVL